MIIFDKCGMTKFFIIRKEKVAYMDKMDKAMDALKARMDKADKIRIVAPGTDLCFSIKGIGSKKCSGGHNIPDGEIYSAPVKDSVNGVITYTDLNTKTCR